MNCWLCDSLWETNIMCTCQLGLLLTTRHAFFASCSSLSSVDTPSPHAVASFVYYLTYCNTPGNNEVRVTDWLASALHRLSAQHQSDSWQAALADCKNLIRHDKCSTAIGRFCWMVKIRPDLDTGWDICPSLHGINAQMWPSIKSNGLCAWRLICPAGKRVEWWTE